MSRAQEALGGDLGIAPIPEIFGPGTWGGSHNLAVTTAAANDPNLKQAAYYFMDWFSQNSLNWGAAGQIPARNEVREEVTSATDGLLPLIADVVPVRSEEHTSELQSRQYLVCRLLLEKKKL